MGFGRDRAYSGRMRSRRVLGLGTTMAALLAVLPVSARADVPNDHWYANQTPYGNAETAEVKAPPAGYEMVFLETVARHGSRAMVTDDAEDRAMAIWRSARSKGKLTTRGTSFDDDIVAFQKAEKAVGYGRLSTIGKQEWRGIGRRTADSYAGFFADVKAAGDRITMTTSPVYRTKQSATSMRGGISGQVPGLTFAPRTVDKDLVITSGASKAGNAAIAKVLRRSSVRDAARHVLLRLYRGSYVDRIGDPVAAALDVYALYQQAAGMQADTDVTFATYVPVGEAKVLASAKDAQNFYRYGPGVKGERSSFKQAEPILDDFFDRIEARLDGGSTAAVFRHAHGETTMPFAALIRAPGSGRQAPKSKPYSYGSNPWRGYLAGRLAGSIEWSVFRNASGSVLVTMRYNEKPVKFVGSCEASVHGGGYFYRVPQLKKCLG
jgi:hypothetical protein